MHRGVQIPRPRDSKPCAPTKARYFFFSSFFLWWSASPCTIPAQATQMVLGEGLPQMEHTDFFFGATDT